MLLKDILKGVNILDTKFEVDFEKNIDFICYNSKEAKENSLFVAIKGYITDGHKFIAEALAKGSCLAIVEDFKDIDIAQIKVENSRKTLADISKNFFNDPSKKLDITGITATNGKTTTSFMVDKIYKDAGYKTGIIGTVYVKYDNVNIPSILTTPESYNLQEFFADMVNKNIDKVTMEVSSSAEELYRVRNVDFDIVTFNNFSREHIDQHGSFENYYAVKSKLIKEASENSIAILNMDFPHIAALKDKTKARVLSYSLENDNYDFSISNLDLSTGFGKYKFNILKDIEAKGRLIKKGAFNIELSVAGYSSVMNSFVAIIVALVQGVDTKIIQESINSFKGVERRFEMIYDKDFKIIDDHYANVRNIEVTLKTLSKMDFNNMRMVYAIRGNRGVNLNRECAEVTAKWLKKLKVKTFYASMSEDTVSSKDKVSDDELEVFKSVMDKNGIKVKIYKNLKDSIESILTLVEDGDIVLFAGCQGMDKGAKFAYSYMKDKNLIKDNGEFEFKVEQRTC
ncbi:Mur ligase family protein [Peptoniphilus catoniae]|uniref:Mur ligase family protein n=1 Tax=Peptoniphilus catoniae TaxID=1660341 RepID=UPI0010FEC611|nr:Mur ligase family protein [Peptoniphilus catoniae]